MTKTCSGCTGTFTFDPFDRNKAGGMCDLHPGLCLTCCLSFGRGPITAAQHFEIWTAREISRREQEEVKV